MRLITAPEKIDTFKKSVFLSGGIANCPDWQDAMVNFLRGYNLTILNPRRKNFPIEDPSEIEKQINWKFNAINNATVVSFWFSKSDYVHGMALYELGRQLEYRKKRLDTIIIGVEPGYLISKDIYIQTALVNQGLAENINKDLRKHAIKVVEALQNA